MSRSTSNPIIIFLFEIVQERGRPRCGARVQAQPGGTGRGSRRRLRRVRGLGRGGWERWLGEARGRVAETPARPAPARRLQLLAAAGVPTSAGTLTPGEPGERVGESPRPPAAAGASN